MGSVCCKNTTIGESNGIGEYSPLKSKHHAYKSTIDFNR